MHRISQTAAFAAVLALAGFNTPAVRADVHTNTSHQTFIAFDPASQTAELDAYDTVTADLSGDTAAKTVSVLGDPATFSWDGSGALAVTNVTPGSAALTVSGAPLVGYSHYTYNSASGDGLFTSSTSGGVTTFSLAGLPTDLAEAGADYSVTLSLLGSYVPGSVSVPSGYTDFVSYDPGTDITTFSAHTASFSGVAPSLTLSATSVPEPGSCALFVGMALSGIRLAARRLRRRN